MKPFGTKVKISPDVSQLASKESFPKKEILWCSQEGGNSRFPEHLSYICNRQKAESPAPLIAFSEAASQARNRIWVIDSYFLKPNEKSGSIEKHIQFVLEQWMPPQTFAAKDVRILARSHNKQIDSEIDKLFRAHEEKIHHASRRQPTKCQILLRTHLRQKFNYLHDRFAIIDEELWHFGATVGGFHPDVNAASRGWRAKDHGAEEFFIMAWDAGE